MEYRFPCGDVLPCFLVTLLLTRENAGQYKIPKTNLVLRWQINTRRFIPQVIAQDIILARDETEAKAGFLSAFWEQQISLARRFSVTEVKALRDILLKHFGLLTPPSDTQLIVESFSSHAIEVNWLRLLNRCPELQALTHPPRLLPPPQK